MSILVGRDTRLVVQGITGREGSFHAMRSREYGANLVSGVTPGRGGQIFDGDVPVYNTVEQAVEETGADASLVFVPPPFAADAIVEAADAGISVIACITEGIPIMDTVRVVRYLKGKPTDPDRPQLSWHHIAWRGASRWALCRVTSIWPDGWESSLAAARSPTRRWASLRGWASGSPRALESAAIRSTARRSWTS